MEAEIVSAKIENKNGILFSTGATGDNEGTLLNESFRKNSV